jgi:anti-sigma factor RsiW
MERYRQGRASPAELLGMDDHLASCETCRARAFGMDEADAVATSLRTDLEEAAALESDHLDYEHLAAYADGTLDEVDAEIAAGHLAVCDDCEREVLDLRAFKESAAPGFERNYGPPIRAHKRETLRQRFAGLWRLPARWPSLSAATFAASLLLALFAGAWLVWKSSMTDAPQTQLAETPTAPAAAPGRRDDQSPTDNSEQIVSSTPAPRTEIVLALNDGGGRVTLDREGNLAGAETLPPAQQEIVKSALKTGRIVNPSALAGLGVKAGTLMGGASSGESFAVRGPAGVVVETARPTLRWNALGGATSYKVTIYDSDFNPVATSPALSTETWTPPRNLARGAIYSWQVTATKGGAELKAPQPPAPEAKFKVLESAKANELQRARQITPRSHLLLGILYARAGLLDDAERELRALRNANPQSDAARRLLAHVRAAKRQQ